jgi:hypothetical protein
MLNLKVSTLTTLCKYFTFKICQRANRAARDYIPTRVLKDKFITPSGIFKTKKEIQKVLNIPEWTLNTIYNNLDALPTSNGRGSKKITHLNINPNITWRDNGFSLVSVS